MNRMNMKKIGAAVLAAGLALSVSGCSGKTENSVKNIQQAGVFRVAIVNSNNQYTSMEGSDLIGFEPELAKTISAALGVSTEFQVLDKEAALAAVTAGTADVAMGCIDGSVSMTDNYLFTTSYGKGFYYAVTEKGDYAQSPSAFANAVIGMNSNLGNDVRMQITSAEGVTVHEYGNAETAASDIKSERIRAYICSEDEAKTLLSDPKLQVQNLFGVDAAEYVIIAEKTDTALVNGMNTMIAQFLVKE